MRAVSLQHIMLVRSTLIAMKGRLSTRWSVIRPENMQPYNLCSLCRKSSYKWPSFI